MIKYPKRIIKKDTPTKDRHAGVILEEVKSMFEYLVEGFDALDKDLRGEMITVGRDVNDLKEAIGILTQRINHLKIN